MNIFINFSIYQIAWFLSVFRENSGALLALPLLAVHLYLSKHKKADLKMMGLLLASGLLIDGTLHAIGCLSFNAPSLPIPFWLGTVWLFLATLPNHSLAWLKGRSLLSMIFGALGGPLAYWAGVRVGAASFVWDTGVALITIAVIWAILWPLVMHFANHVLPK